MLDPELQPEQPNPSSKLSQQIFNEHQKLAKEYLRVDTELYYANDRKEKILASMDPNEKQEKLTILKKLMEKEELLGLYKDLQKQLEQIKATQAAGVSNCDDITATTTITDDESIDSQQLENDNLKSSSPSGDDEPPDQQAEDGWVFLPSNQS